jgi:hypothetical protein
MHESNQLIILVAMGIMWKIKTKGKPRDKQ